MQHGSIEHETNYYVSSNRPRHRNADLPSSLPLSNGVAAAEELGLEIKQVCWLAGFGNKHLMIGAPASQVRFIRF